MTDICLVRLVFWTLGSLLLATSTALVIEIKPEKLTESMKGNVDIKCRVDTSDVDQIISFGISKDQGPQLAFVKEGGPPSYDATKYHAVVSDNYLKLSILHPGQSDQGEYTCKLDFMNKRGKKQVRTVSSRLVDDLDIRQLVLSMKKEISYLKVRTSVLRDEMSYLLEQDKKDQVTCYFNAFTGKQPMGYRGTIVYKDVRHMHGSAYDPATGIFTAPVHGVYAFNFNFMIECGYCSVQISMYHGGKVLVWAYVDNTLYGTGSASCVKEMKKGETADVRQDWGAGAIRQGSFSGYLVKAIY